MVTMAAPRPDVEFILLVTYLALLNWRRVTFSGSLVAWVNSAKRIVGPPHRCFVVKQWYLLMFLAVIASGVNVLLFPQQSST